MTILDVSIYNSVLEVTIFPYLLSIVEDVILFSMHVVINEVTKIDIKTSCKYDVHPIFRISGLHSLPILPFRFYTPMPLLTIILPSWVFLNSIKNDFGEKYNAKRKR